MKIIYKITILVLVSFISIASSAVLNLTPEQLIQAQNQGTVVVDIRTPSEWKETGAITNAKRIMFFDEQRKPLINEFMNEFQKLVSNKDQTFILVCRSGSRTHRVAQFLDKQLGYTHGAHLSKGMKQWLKEKRKVEH